MRLFLALLLLGSLFGLAWAWQAGTLASLRDKARAATVDQGGHRDPTYAPLPEGWGVVVIGSPSGADPVPGVAPFAERALPAPGDGIQPRGHHGHQTGGATAAATEASWSELEQRALGDFRVEVFGGQTLFSIAKTYYGSANKQLCAALAYYNGLDNAATLEVGETLLLPPIERLQP